MTVRIEPAKQEPPKEPALPQEPEPEAVAPPDDPPPAPAPEPSVEPVELVPDETRDIDWRQAAAESVVAIQNDKQRQEEARSRLWQTNRSIMFQGGPKIIVEEPEPVLDDFSFKPEIHVGGVGLTIGSCFIGVPLVGVPVEHRTVGPNLFVCAQD